VVGFRPPDVHYKRLDTLLNKKTELWNTEYYIALTLTKVRNMIWDEFLLFVACSKVTKNNTRKYSARAQNAPSKIKKSHTIKISHHIIKGVQIMLCVR
jgi:Trm5-related predicted tRNA methylase